MRDPHVSYKRVLAKAALERASSRLDDIGPGMPVPSELQCPGCDAVRALEAYEACGGFGLCPDCGSLSFMPRRGLLMFGGPQNKVPDELVVEHLPPVLGDEGDYRSNMPRMIGTAAFSVEARLSDAIYIPISLSIFVAFFMGLAMVMSAKRFLAEGLLALVAGLLLVALAFALKRRRLHMRVDVDALRVAVRPVGRSRRIPRTKVDRIGVVSLGAEYSICAYLHGAGKRRTELFRVATAGVAMYSRALLEDALGFDASDDWRNPDHVEPVEAAKAPTEPIDADDAGVLVPEETAKLRRS